MINNFEYRRREEHLAKSRLTPPFFLAKIEGGSLVLMTIKLMLLKSGEDVIADVTEMVSGTSEETVRVIGYFLEKPCIIKMRNQNLIDNDDAGNMKTSGFEVSLFPWIPLSKDEKIPIPSDWLITMVEPVTKLKEMYIEDIVNYGKNNQNSGTDEQSNSNQSN